MRLRTQIIGAIVVACFAAELQAEPETQGFSVEVTFATKLQSRLASIDNVERRLERQFRKNRHYQSGNTFAGTQRSAASLTTGTEWAGERLIGDLDEFTLENLIRSMVIYNVERAVPDFRGSIRVELREIGLSNAPVAFIKRFRSYAEGDISVTRADGSILFSGPIRTNLVVNPAADLSFAGPELAFSETDPPKRVGPTLAYFIEHALEKAWPELEEQIVGPVVIRVSGPNARVVQGSPGS